MNDPIARDRSRELVLGLRRLAAERAAAEESLVAAFAAKKEAAEKQYQEAQKEAAARHQRDRADTDAEYLALRNEIVARFQAEQSRAEQQCALASREAVAQCGRAELDEKRRLQDAQWQAMAVFEAAKNALDARLKEASARLAALDQELVAIAQETQQVLQRRNLWGVAPPAPPAAPSLDSPVQQYFDLVALARNQLQGLCLRRPPGLLQRAIPWLGRAAREQDAQAAQTLRQTLARAEAVRGAAAAAIQADWQRQTAAITAQLNAETQRADEAFGRATAELKLRKQQLLTQAEKDFAAAHSAATARHNSERRELEQRYAQRLAEIDARHARESGDLERGYLRTVAEWEARFQQDWAAMSAAWLTGVEGVASALDEMNAACAKRFPPWDSAAWNPWTPPEGIPSAIPFGRLQFALADLEGGVPKDEALMPARSEFSLPAMFALRDRSLLLLKARGEGRARAIEALQVMMLRMITSIRPGKVRFLIVDPVGLGENFSAFMHLADYDEQLVASRIWTEGQHIERRLAELTEHMENVIQVYLRNEFQSIQDYNESAGELAEPYRVLVVANFPANFSEVAARRLLSIVASGARCGVYTLLSLDSALPLPREFQLADLERNAIKLTWAEGRFRWEDPDLVDLPLCLEPPPVEHFTELVRRVGELAKDAGRIELPFQCVIPDQQQWWTADSRHGVDVPLGRAGVTKLQHLQLGRGTSQHVLIAGKTGAGKSTLLHVLIVNVALRYRPDQIELYLVDFKKGVEFKAYAEAGLPHARVIAIESEREFGLSVLERLDLELKHRGDLFRQRGVQDLPAFRAAAPELRMPRVLLIVDEFQELFVEDDRIAQHATLLLDRLVRQGRAFGIHVLLGSQTLGGAYSIPRSTIGQMAVRIALQCSEADAHLILSEENTAARLLARPGEAIYNDANGLYEGNHPFQVVWLSDAEREQYLARVRQFAHQRGAVGAPPVVFEGNLPADPARNQALCDLLRSPSWAAPCFAAKAWLGSAVAIKEPTAAVFPRQSGAHLLLVGHQEESALGVLATGLISLAAQHAPGNAHAPTSGAQFYVLDGTRPDSPQAGFWDRVASVVPHAVKVVGPRGASEVIAQIAAELARREAAGDESSPPIYLFVYDLSRFRDLRKAEDDFGFARAEEEGPPQPGRQFRTILHEGPAFGIHALIWCDSLNSVGRSLDRQGLDDVEMRVLFRMNAADSSSLIDSPAASQLGLHRALFDDQGQNLLEKFRPYGPPSSQWLAWVKTRLCGPETSPSG